MARGVLAGTAGTVWLRVTSLLAIPLLVHELGLGLYGVWAVTDLLIAGQGLVDIGILQATVKFVADAEADDDPGAARRIVRFSLVWYTALNVLVGALFLALLSHIPNWLDVTPGRVDDAKILLGGGVIIFALSNYAYVFGHTLLGLQDATALNVVYGLSRFPYLALLGATAVADWGAIGVVIATVVMYAIQIGWLGAIVTRRLPDRPIRADRPVAIGQLLRFGSKTYVATMADFVALQAPKLIAARTNGARSVARFDLASRIPVVAASLSYPIQGPTIAAASRLSRQDRLSEADDLIARTTRYLLLVALPLFGLVVIAGPEALRVWVGSDGGGGLGSVMRWLVPGTLLNGVLVGILAVLTGRGAVGLVARYKAVLLIATLGFMVGGALRWELPGIAGGLSVAAAVSAVYLGILVHRTYGVAPLLSTARAATGPGTAIIGASALTLFVTQGLAVDAGAPWTGAAILVAAYIALLPLTHGLTADDVRLVKGAFARPQAPSVP